MKDVHKKKSKRHINIDEVGISDAVIPVSIREKNGAIQQVAANVKLSVDLSNMQKGAHMSRFIEVINDFTGQIFNESDTIKSLLINTQKALKSKSAGIKLSFTYFITKEAPISKKSSLMGYRCILGGKINDSDRIMLTTKIFVPISTVCPCSKEISAHGAHNQRGEVVLSVTSDDVICLEDLISLVEGQGSQQVYPLLKRVDEKEVTERMFLDPKFVEDVVRDITLKIQKDLRVNSFRIQCTNFESIHQHNVYAKIDKRL